MSSSIANSRVWFITGSSRGLGRALLEEVLARGERVAAACRNPEAVSSLTVTYPAAQLLTVPLDVTSQEQITRAFEETGKHFHRLDVLVNCAGYGLNGEVETTPEDAAREQIEVLFWGPYRICKAAIPIMRDINPAGQGGVILNISSCGGYSANQTLPFYSAGKFALEGFTEALRKEMVPAWNIKVVIIQPGGFSTDWATSSLVRAPIAPQYAQPDTPSAQFRSMTKNTNHIGDPAKAAKAMFRVASLPNPPLRIQLGSESLALIKQAALTTAGDAERYAEIAHSTNLDGVNKDEVLQRLQLLFQG